jgi:hypothetical protein
MKGVNMDAILKRNPHRKGSIYWNLFKYMMRPKPFTRQELLEKKIGSYFDVTIVLSPRKTSKRGDARGNPAAHGHLYYLEPIPKTIRGEYKRFTFHWRKEALPRRTRTPIIVAQKVDRKGNVVEVKRNHKVTVKA